MENRKECGCLMHLNFFFLLNYTLCNAKKCKGRSKSNPEHDKVQKYLLWKKLRHLTISTSRKVMYKGIEMILKILNLTGCYL